MKAVVISSNKDQLTEIQEVQLPQIKDNEILVQSKAVALNPTDWKHIVYGLGKAGDLVGSDVSGTVVQIGSSVEKFSIGDSVSSFVAGNCTTTYGAFAEYVICHPNATIKYDHLSETVSEGTNKIISFPAAASVTLGLVTVALSYSHSLKLDNCSSVDHILIWGGATTTGLLAIQIAKKLYNLNIITTASPKNFQLLKSLGADHVFDYNDPKVVDKIREAGQSQIKFGLDIIATKESFQNVYDSTDGSDQVYLDTLNGLDETSIKVNPDRSVQIGRTAGYMAVIKEKHFGPLHFKQTPEMMHDYTQWWTNKLPLVIDQIQHPKLLLLNNGLNSVNEGLSLLMDGKVSAEKVVISL